MIPFLLFTAAGAASVALQAPEPLMNGEELNAACARAEEPDERFYQCDQVALFVLMNFARLGPGSTEAGGDLLFCLPRTALVSVEHIRPLIEAYREQYRRDPRAFSAMQPLPAFLRAMRRQWPCEGGR